MVSWMFCDGGTAGLELGTFDGPGPERPLCAVGLGNPPGCDDEPGFVGSGDREAKRIATTAMPTAAPVMPTSAVTSRRLRSGRVETISEADGRVSGATSARTAG